jgi:hypothetical protein
MLPFGASLLRFLKNLREKEAKQIEAALKEHRRIEFAPLEKRQAYTLVRLLIEQFEGDIRRGFIKLHLPPQETKDGHLIVLTSPEAKMEMLVDEAGAYLGGPRGITVCFKETHSENVDVKITSYLTEGQGRTPASLKEIADYSSVVFSHMSEKEERLEFAQAG